MSGTTPDSTNDLHRTLGLEKSAAVRRRVRVWLIGSVLLALAGLAIAFLAGGEDESVRFRTSDAQTGDLTVIVTATGQLKPVNQVDVGTEVSGTIENVAVDYNDRVSAGQVLAQLDTAKLEAQVLQSKAALASARARVKEMEATVVETRLKSERCKRLAEKSLCSREDLDTAQAAHLRAQAQETDARAKVAEATAKLSLDETDLNKAVIRAPIDAIVLERQVEPGQTVAASLQTPVLFTLAEDLRQMELHVDVDEADVGQVREGQPATFTVDAYPTRSFPARITQVRYAPRTVEGVVTYETLLSVDNADLSLRPGMTATADITVKTVEDALLVPNTALRFTPPATAAHAPQTGGGLLSRLLIRRSAKKTEPPAGKPAAGSRQQVWVLRDGTPVAVPVTVGVSDSRQTEILEGELDAGMPVIVDMTGSGQ
ncbi:MAG: efflux RND transporter periplasmic adaptor subunit [Gammaproteobacteria bacterium]